MFTQGSSRPRGPRPPFRGGRGRGRGHQSSNTRPQGPVNPPPNGHGHPRPPRGSRSPYHEKCSQPVYGPTPSLDQLPQNRRMHQPRPTMPPAPRSILPRPPPSSTPASTATPMEVIQNLSEVPEETSTGEPMDYTQGDEEQPILIE